MLDLLAPELVKRNAIETHIKAMLTECTQLQVERFHEFYPDLSSVSYAGLDAAFNLVRRTVVGNRQDGVVVNTSPQSQIEAGPLKIIHVNRHHIAANRKDGGNRPCYTIKVAGRSKAVYARAFKALGEVEGVADTRQLSCGARVWLETKAALELTDEMTYEEAKAAFSDAVLD